VPITVQAKNLESTKQGSPDRTQPLWLGSRHFCAVLCTHVCLSVYLSVVTEIIIYRCKQRKMKDKVTFQVLTAVLLKIKFRWHVALCRWVLSDVSKVPGFLETSGSIQRHSVTS